MGHILIENEKVEGQYAVRLNNLLCNLADCLNQSSDLGVKQHVLSELNLATELLERVPKTEIEEAQRLSKYMNEIRNIASL